MINIDVVFLFYLMIKRLNNVNIYNYCKMNFQVLLDFNYFYVKLVNFIDKVSIYC